MSSDNLHNDLERIEALSVKLAHPLIDIRLRSAVNLLSKFTAGIFSSDLLKLPSCAANLANAIRSSLKLITLNDNEKDSKEGKDMLKALIALIKEISKYVNTDNVHAFAELLSDSFKIASMDDIDASIKGMIQDSIAKLTTTTSGNNSNDTMNITGNIAATPAPIYDTSDFMIAKDDQISEQPVIIGGGGVGSSGAGSILYSHLCYEGWHFPRVVLSDLDEKLLFDTEVKIKLAHEGCGDLLRDVLADFPAEVLLSRPGLIESVLNIAGSSLSIADNTESSSSFSLSLAPIKALEWCEKLLMKSVKSFENILSGAQCSSASYPTGAVSYAGAEVDVTIGRSLAANLSKAMAEMRYPQYLGNDNQVNLDINGDGSSHDSGNKASTMGVLSLKGGNHVKMSAPVVSSLAGFAFSICAAALPIFRSQDSNLRASAYQVLHTALPYVIEPVSLTDGLDSDGTRADDVAFAATKLSRDRLQHLLNRIEQMLSTSGNSNNNNMDSGFLFMPPHKVSLDEFAKTPDAMNIATGDLLYLNMLTEVFGTVAEAILDECHTLNDADATVNPFTLGSYSIATLKHIVSSPSTSDVLSAHVMDRLFALLAMTDPMSFHSIVKQRDCLSAAVRLITTATDTERAHQLLLQRTKRRTEGWDVYSSEVYGDDHIEANEYLPLSNDIAVKTLPIAIHPFNTVASDAFMAASHFESLEHQYQAGQITLNEVDSLHEMYASSVIYSTMALIATAVSTGDEVALEDVLQTLFRLLRSCGLSVRTLTLESLLHTFFDSSTSSMTGRSNAYSTLQVNIQHVLACPDIVRDLIYMGIFNLKNGSDDTSGRTTLEANCAIFAYELLDNLLRLLLLLDDNDFNRSTSGDSDGWRALLKAMKVITLDTDTDTNINTNTNDNDKVTSKFPHLASIRSLCVSDFIQRLNVISGIEDPTMEILGLFHPSSTIRGQSASKLGAYGRANFPGLLRSSSGRSVYASLTDIDPFDKDYPTLASCLVSLDAALERSTSRGNTDIDGASFQPKGNVNIRQLLAIAFGDSNTAPDTATTTTSGSSGSSGSSGYDTSIRITALRQLRSIIRWHQGKSNDIDFLSRVCDKCLHILSEFVADMKALTKVGREVLALLVTTVSVDGASNIRSSLLHRTRTCGDSETATTSLWPLIGIVLRGGAIIPTTSDGEGGELMEVGVDVVLAAAALHAVTFDSSTWCPSSVGMNMHDVDGTPIVMFKSNNKNSISSSSKGQLWVQIPGFLHFFKLATLHTSSSFLLEADEICPLITTAAMITTSTHNSFDDDNVDVDAQVGITVGEVRGLIVSGLETSDETGQLTINMCYALVSAIKKASSHKAIRGLLAQCNALITSFTPSVAFLILPSNGQPGITSSLSRILSLQPRSQSDLVTLSYSIDVLTACLRVHSSDQTIRIVLDAISAPVFKVLSYHEFGLQTFTPPAGVTQSESAFKTYSKHFDLARNTCMESMLSLLKCVISHRSGVTLLCDKLSYEQSIVEDLGILVSIEVLPSFVRESASHILEMLATMVTNDISLESILIPTSSSILRDRRLNSYDFSDPQLMQKEANEKEETLAYLYNAFKTVRMVRNPDSFKGTSFLLPTLRMISSTIVNAMSVTVSDSRYASANKIINWCAHADWNWIKRLIHDRRAAIKVVAIDLVGAVTMAQTSLDVLNVPSSSNASSSEENEKKWPPLSSLRCVVMDEKECPAARSAALKVYGPLIVHSVTTATPTPSTSTTTSTSSSEKDISLNASISQLMASAVACVTLTGPTASAHSIQSAFSAISACMDQLNVNNSNNNNSSNNTLKTVLGTAARSTKLLNLALASLHTSVFQDMISSCVCRLGMSVNASDGNNKNSFGLNNVELNKRIFNNNSDSSATEPIRMNGGWSYCWHKTRDDIALSLSCARAAVGRAMTSLHVQDTTWLGHAARHTAIIPSVVNALLTCNTAFNTEETLVSESLDVNSLRCYTIDGLCNLLGSVISAQEKEKTLASTVNLTTIPAKTMLALAEIMSGQCSRLSDQLRLLLSDIQNDGACAEICSISSICKALSFVCNSSLWTSEISFQHLAKIRGGNDDDTAYEHEMKLNEIYNNMDIGDNSLGDIATAVKYTPKRLISYLCMMRQCVGQYSSSVVDSLNTMKKGKTNANHDRNGGIDSNPEKTNINSNSSSSSSSSSSGMGDMSNMMQMAITLQDMSVQLDTTIGVLCQACPSARQELGLQVSDRESVCHMTMAIWADFIHKGWELHQKISQTAIDRGTSDLKGISRKINSKSTKITQNNSKSGSGSIRDKEYMLPEMCLTMDAIEQALVEEVLPAPLWSAIVGLSGCLLDNLPCQRLMEALDVPTALLCLLRSYARVDGLISGAAGVGPAVSLWINRSSQWRRVPLLSSSATSPSSGTVLLPPLQCYSSAIISACCALTYTTTKSGASTGLLVTKVNHNENKTKSYRSPYSSSKSSKAKINNSKTTTVRSGAAAMKQLLQYGLSCDGVINTNPLVSKYSRLVSLRLIASLAESKRNVPFASKLNASNSLNQSIQQALHNGCAPQMVAVLLDCMGCFMCSEASYLSHPSSSSSSSRLHIRGRNINQRIQKDDDDYDGGHHSPTYTTNSSTFKAISSPGGVADVHTRIVNETTKPLVISFPKLTKWITDEAGSPEVLTALARIIGRFGSPSVQPGVVMSKRLMSNVATESCMQILMQIATQSYINIEDDDSIQLNIRPLTSSSSSVPSSSPSLSSDVKSKVACDEAACSAAVALWAVLHGSEQARAIAKSCISHYGSGLKSHPIGGSDMGVRLLKEKVGAYVGTLLYQ